MSIVIRLSIPDDVYGIRYVQRKTWMQTYPNKQEGITAKDISDKFRDDETPAGKKRIEERKKQYDNKHIKIWVAQEQSTIVGFCASTKENNNNRIGAMYVLPNYQRQGIGNLLITEALNWLRNANDIFVNVARYNLRAIEFYKKFYFVETGKSGVLDTASQLPSGTSIPEIEMVRKNNHSA